MMNKYDGFEALKKGKVDISFVLKLTLCEELES